MSSSNFSYVSKKQDILQFYLRYMTMIKRNNIKLVKRKYEGLQNGFYTFGL